MILQHFVRNTAVGGPGATVYVVILGAFLLLPTVFLVHASRMKYREKHQLLMDLRHFQLETLSCETEFDRSFIMNAVDEWYGSRETFTNLVRGPLCEELLSMLPNPHLPLSFAALIASSPTAQFLEQAASLHLAGANSAAIFVHIFSSACYLLCLPPLFFNLVFYVADRLAAPGTWVPDCMKTFAGVGLALAWVLGSVTAALRSRDTGSVWLSLICVILHVMLTVWVFRPACSLAGHRQVNEAN